VVPFRVLDTRSVDRARWWRLAALWAAIAVIAGGVALADRWLEPENATAEPTVTVPSTTTTTVPQSPVPPVTWLASPHGMVAVFDAPGGQQIGEAGIWYDRPMTLPILERRGDWVLVRLPERPNGSTGWMQLQDVELSSTPYHIIVNVPEANVTVFKDGWPQFTIPAGVGKASTPTPRGNFFVAVIEQPGPPGYGPIVLDTSGHSEAIQSWEGAGDAIIALHGPISSSSDARIGTTGTHISNGCIRLHVEDQLKLAPIPLGTPVDIVA